jgi:hypothetical protein
VWILFTFSPLLLVQLRYCNTMVQIIHCFLLLESLTIITLQQYCTTSSLHRKKERAFIRPVFCVVSPLFSACCSLQPPSADASMEGPFAPIQTERSHKI